VAQEEIAARSEVLVEVLDRLDGVEVALRERVGPGAQGREGVHAAHLDDVELLVAGANVGAPFAVDEANAVGERVCAFIIPRPRKTFDKEKIRTYLKSRLSSFKVPKEYRLVKDLPRSPAGKVLKRELRKEILEDLPEKS